MGYVTFVGMKLPDRIQVNIDPDAEVKLLDVAGNHGIPLPCDCMQGHCGSCAVKVAPLFSAPQMTRLSLRERYFLLRAGKISAAQYQNEYFPDHPPLWRLACEYQITDEKIMVAF